MRTGTRYGSPNSIDVSMQLGVEERRLRNGARFAPAFLTAWPGGETTPGRPPGSRRGDLGRRGVVRVTEDRPRRRADGRSRRGARGHRRPARGLAALARRPRLSEALPVRHLLRVGWSRPRRRGRRRSRQKEAGLLARTQALICVAAPPTPEWIVRRYSPSSRAMIVSWISVVPSVIVMRRAARQKRSTGNSVMYPYPPNTCTASHVTRCARR